MDEDATWYGSIDRKKEDRKKKPQDENIMAGLIL